MSSKVSSSKTVTLKKYETLETKYETLVNKYNALKIENNNEKFMVKSLTQTINAMVNYNKELTNAFKEGKEPDEINFNFDEIMTKVDETEKNKLEALEQKKLANLEKKLAEMKAKTTSKKLTQKKKSEDDALNAKKQIDAGNDVSDLEDPLENDVVKQEEVEEKQFSFKDCFKFEDKAETTIGELLEQYKKEYNDESMDLKTFKRDLTDNFEDKIEFTGRFSAKQIIKGIKIASDN